MDDITPISQLLSRRYLEPLSPCAVSPTRTRYINNGSPSKLFKSIFGHFPK